MKSHTMFYRQFFSVFIIALIMTLASCSVSKRPKQDSSVTNQLGDAIQTHLVASKASSELEITTALSRMKVSKSSKVIISKHKDNIIHLYSTDTLLLIKKDKYRGNEISEKLVNFDDTPSAISTLITLFPIDAYRILTYAAEKNLIDKSRLLAIAVEYNIDPTIVLDASATGMENSVTPLIHSAGIVIYGQDEGNWSEVKYKVTGDNSWQPAFELSWDPVYGSLSGSIVHLEADTSYDVEVLVWQEKDTNKLYTFSFRTRPNTPPIDPDKIYYLSEIYSGGQLDLEALNIYGSEDGYAKIIGDGQTILASDDVGAAVNIGSQAYIVLENLTIKGGKRYGIYAKNTHDIWIKGCNISNYGQVPNFYKNNIGYVSEDSSSPINYDSGIYLERTGIVVIEGCEIHSPNHKANHWGDGHPKGPNAVQIWAYHPEEKYRGQIIIRNNRLFGTDTHRFNDVIEGRKNTELTGGFVRDSAIYGNYLAYANDDLLEIDGSQRNVLVYNNELTKGYAGISIAPNRLGPSYLFHNYIHDLGDERGKEWTAIKAGGLLSKPGGKTYIVENFINTDRNGISGSSVASDKTFWVEALNNIIINRLHNRAVGLGIYDIEKYHLSKFINNVIYNTKVNRPNLDVASDSLVEHPLTNDSSYILSLDNDPSVILPLSSEFVVPNFSRLDVAPQAPVANEDTDNLINIDIQQLSKFDNQTKYGEPIVTNNNRIKLSGNSWYKIPVDINVSEGTTLSLDYEIDGIAEIIGIALETNNSLTASKVLKFAGTQNLGNNLELLLNKSTNGHVNIDLSKYHLGTLSYIVFILDNDEIERINNKTTVTFSNLEVTTLKSSANEKETFIPIGIKN
ncbi:right-handed parallel beta-helix repeat-containing protein [Alteromonas sp. 1_MG-2023]|uniref:right-handed parallel beta-helix repeat-containing protein n=1 Tax=Alteromonas sp. 1_MG-2023 TaxID=3062669 RepID=UPI0026E17DBF|nr:right-handed parallel beta-helix repeat-containing protein [Alteromonas sp. 1_MG-2023]MDO6567505.1 right-handed parallel beta-helix repeat-containing protein [Alteromonas sp. 1_MG-2023]